MLLFNLVAVVLVSFGGFAFGSEETRQGGGGERAALGAKGYSTSVGRGLNRVRRSPTGFSARGFHENVFDRDFGHFSPVKRRGLEKRRPEADAAGFYGDTFSNGFGEFETMKRDGMMGKRRPEMGATGFHGDTFAQGFGDFETMKRRPEMTKAGFHDDVFNGGFGAFHPM